MLKILKIALVLIVVFHSSYAQIILITYDNKKVYRNQLTFKDTANYKINTIRNNEYPYSYSQHVFLGFEVGNERILFHDTTYLVENQTPEFYKTHLKKMQFGNRYNKFSYDNLYISRRYAYKTAKLLDDSEVGGLVGKYYGLDFYKYSSITVAILSGVTLLANLFSYQYSGETQYLNNSIICGSVFAISITSSVAIPLRQLKLNKKIIKRYNSLLLNP